MATFPTRLLLSLLLFNLTNFFILGRIDCVQSIWYGQRRTQTENSSKGPPAPPSAPDCYIPCDENNCFGDVYCSWDPRQKSEIPTTYSLQWRTTHNNVKEVKEITTTKFNGLILRNHLSNPAKLFVWVQAKNQHGSANSSVVVFNTTDIIKPPPPKFTHDPCYEEFEIWWHSLCDQLGKFMGFCDVRYRTDTDQTWIEKKGFYGSFFVENPENCTAYELQVRCTCGTSLASNWSASCRIPGSEMAPVGKVDLWMDCEISAKASNCILTWRKLPIYQACGVILGYEIKLTQSGNATVLVNLSTSQPGNQLECDEMQCRFTDRSSIKDATSVSLSAYNVNGATTPSYLPKLVTDSTEHLPCSGKWETQHVLHFKMSLKNITVSWKVPPQLSNSLKEYVVQYKQAGTFPGHAFSWVKLNKSQTTAFFKGQFKEYTPYEVALFAVLHENKVHHLSSVIGYSLQRAPAKVSSFKVMSIATTDVTLWWEPLPLSKQEGLVLCYQIGVVQNKKVYNVSALSPDQCKTEKVLQHLNPGQEYEAWIRAMTAAGPGEKTTLRFKTKHQEYFDYWIALGIPGCIFIFFVAICVFTRKNKLCPLSSRCYGEQIPDPKNSYIFREMKHQLHDPVTWISSPSNELLPKLIVLEVVLIQPSLQKITDADELNTTTIGEWSSPTERHKDQRKDAVAEDNQRTEAYSKMVDSDEERSWSSSEEEPCISGYEKHFMPTAVEVLEDF